jgi:hypothetical protein
MIEPDPLDAVPMEQNVAVPEPPVPDGNTMLAWGDDELVVEVVQPPVVRATETREYPVYVTSLDD